MTAVDTLLDLARNLFPPNLVQVITIFSFKKRTFFYWNLFRPQPNSTELCLNIREMSNTQKPRVKTEIQPICTPGKSAENTQIQWIFWVLSSSQVIQKCLKSMTKRPKKSTRIQKLIKIGFKLCSILSEGQRFELKCVKVNQNTSKYVKTRQNTSNRFRIRQNTS